MGEAAGLLRSANEKAPPESTGLPLVSPEEEVRKWDQSVRTILRATGADQVEIFCRQGRLCESHRLQKTCRFGHTEASFGIGELEGEAAVAAFKSFRVAIPDSSIMLPLIQGN